VPPRDEQRAAWLRLTLVPGIGGETQRSLLKAFGSPQQVFTASIAELARVVPRAAAEKLLSHDCAEAVEAALSWSNDSGNKLIGLGDADYPGQLLEIHDPPTLLYVKGHAELLASSALALVGSRNATPAGLENANNFARALSEAGLTIVSGLALGIDAAAHRGGLLGSGSTIAVVGTGIDRIYPAANCQLAHEIAARGAIVSEFPLGTPVRPANFPRRNRIISGLARGVLVIEAALGSGSLITARLAAEQGREVFAIPGSIHSPLAKGCHRLIKLGAKLVEHVNDIIEELGLPASKLPAAGTAQAQTSPLLEALGFDPCELDTLASRTGYSAEQLTAMLLELELSGRVAALPGGRFQRLT